MPAKTKATDLIGRLPDFSSKKPEDLILYRKLISDVVAYYQRIQKIRISIDNQIDAYSKADTSRPALSKFIELRDAIAAIEVTLYGHICEFVIHHPISEWALGIPGMGPLILVRLLASIPLDSETDFRTFSKLRKYSGICPGADKRIRGQKINFNPDVRTTLFLFGFISRINKDKYENLEDKLKPRKLYIEIYNNWLNKYKERNDQLPEKDRLTSAHISNRAVRKMLDVFLCHFWQVLRETLGFEVPNLYVHEHLGHQYLYRHIDFSNTNLAMKNIEKLKAKVKSIFGSKSKARKNVMSLLEYFGTLPDDEKPKTSKPLDED